MVVLRRPAWRSLDFTSGGSISKQPFTETICSSYTHDWSAIGTLLEPEQKFNFRIPDTENTKKGKERKVTSRNGTEHVNMVIQACE